MLTSTKKRLSMAVVGLALVGAGALTSPAKADPKQFGGVVGVGSDTIQDVFNAFTGYTNGNDYTPLHATTSGGRQIISFDAVDPVNVNNKCISTVLGGPSFNRPNGSGAGAKALSRAIDGTGWSDVNCSTNANGNDVSGQIDFGRSSSGPSGVGSNLTYIPFARDGVSFAWYSKNGTVGANTAFDTLTKAQLTTIFTGSGSGTDITVSANTVHIVPCGIQDGSGTYKFWNTVTTATSAQELAATSLCNSLFPSNGLSGRAEENSGTALKARGDALAAVAGHTNDEVIIGFSAGSYIARMNGAAPLLDANLVNIGSISDNGSAVNLGAPYTGTIGAVPNSLTPSSTFFGDTTFGRNLYIILPTTTVTGPGNNDIKSLFVGSSSVVCGSSAQTTVNKFGFLSLSSGCGGTSQTAPLSSGHI